MNDQIYDPLQPRLTRAEYWLLETAVDGGIPLRFLDSESYGPGWSIATMFNKPGHGLDRVELISCLDRLFQGGLIEVSRGEEQRWIPTHEQIAAALGEKRSESNLAYWLTDRGGSVWEAFAAPDWDRYIEDRFDCERDVRKVTCPARSLLDRYLTYLAFEVTGENIDLTTIQIYEHAPWQATYWKQLARGVTAEFTCHEGESHLPGDNLRQLACSGLYHFRVRWYRWR